jgi:hypothetical protein
VRSLRAKMLFECEYSYVCVCLSGFNLQYVAPSAHLCNEIKQCSAMRFPPPPRALACLVPRALSFTEALTLMQLAAPAYRFQGPFVCS